LKRDVVSTTFERGIDMFKKLTTLAATASFAVLALAGAASADTVECQFSDVAATNPKCSVEVKAVTLPADPTETVAAPRTTAPTNVQLPVTGGDAATLALAGAALLGGGVLLVARSRQLEESA
jgi:LPXTG-motif cell wall-anchored protein